MSNLPDGVTDRMIEQGTMSPVSDAEFREKEEVQDILSDLTSHGDKILLALIDLDVIDGYPETVDEAGEAVDAVQKIEDALEGFTVTKKPDPSRPRRDDVWVSKSTGNYIHIVSAYGQIRYHIVGEPEKIQSASSDYVRDNYKLIAPKRR
jgi:hypothetical protein